MQEENGKKKQENFRNAAHQINILTEVRLRINIFLQNICFKRSEINN